MKNQIAYRTLEELKKHIIDRLNDPKGNPLSVTRAHEAMFGTLIPRAVGEDAPEGKYKVVLSTPLPN
tara:strand:- start:4609 stop:4809 length:201 start_codon:yes stop_codon:yes gene_type:complete